MWKASGQSLVRHPCAPAAARQLVGAQSRIVFLTGPLSRRGLSMVKQHQLVARILAEDIATWHGFQLDVSAPAE